MKAIRRPHPCGRTPPHECNSLSEMGPHASKHEKLPSTPVDHEGGEVWADVFKQPEWDAVVDMLRGREQTLSKLRGSMGGWTHAKLLEKTRVVNVSVPLNEVDRVVSFTRPTRLVSEAHVRAIQDKIAEVGVIGGVNHASLSAALEFVGDDWKVRVRRVLGRLHACQSALSGGSSLSLLPVPAT